MIDVIGWLGAAMLAICGIPQAYLSIKQKHSDGVSWGFLSLWGFGEVFQIIYVFNKLEYPIIVNCALNIVLISIITYYKIKSINIV